MKNTNKGFTLLEVMIALVISAVSLLGLASLQAQSLSFNNSAYTRSQATYFAYDILEKMRMNKTEALAGSYDLAFADIPNSATCTGTIATVNCSQASFAAADKYEWYNLLTTSLPSGAGSVARAIGSGQTIVTIIVRWSNSSTASLSQIQIQGEL